jgi:hypothetical protein
MHRKVKGDLARSRQERSMQQWRTEPAERAHDHLDFPLFPLLHEA